MVVASCSGSWAVVGRELGANMGWRNAILWSIAPYPSGGSIGVIHALILLVARSSLVGGQRLMSEQRAQCYCL